MGLDELKIRELVEDMEQPMLLRIAGKALLTSKGFDIAQSMLDRAHGRARQSVELDISPELSKVPFKGFSFLKALTRNPEGNLSNDDVKQE